MKLIRINDNLEFNDFDIVKWIEFDEDGRGKQSHDEPMIGTSLLLPPFNSMFRWQTTLIKEIIENSEELVHFKTKNSEYKLFK